MVLQGQKALLCPIYILAGNWKEPSFKWISCSDSHRAIAMAQVWTNVALFPPSPPLFLFKKKKK